MLCAVDNWDPILATNVTTQSKNKVIKDFLNNTDYNWIDAQWVYPVAVVSYVTGYVPYTITEEDEVNGEMKDRYNTIKNNSFSETIVLADYYNNSYDSINKIRQLHLLDPYNRIFFVGYNNNIEDYILEWVNYPKDVIKIMNMLPNLGMFEYDYSWDAFRYYEKTVNRKKKREIKDRNTIEESSDNDIVNFIFKKDPEAHIKYKRRYDLILLCTKYL